MKRLILSAPLARAAARGQKTTLHTPVRPGKAGAPYAPLRYVTGELYAVYAQDDPLVPKTHVTITGHSRARLGDVDAAGASRDGFRTLAGWQMAWVNQHDKDWAGRIIDEDTPNEDRRALLLQRFDRHWEAVEVWVVWFECCGDVPRWMAQSPTRLGDDYVTTASLALDPGAEVIDPLTQERFSAIAREDSLRIRRARQDQLSQGQGRPPKHMRRTA